MAGFTWPLVGNVATDGLHQIYIPMNFHRAPPSLRPLMKGSRPRGGHGGGGERRDSTVLTCRTIREKQNYEIRC